MLRAKGMQQSAGTHAKMQARLAQKIDMPKDAVQESSIWHAAACRGASTVSVQGSGPPCVVIGVQGHGFTQDAEELLVRAGVAYNMIYLDPRQPQEAQLAAADSPVPHVAIVPTVVADGRVMQGTGQISQWLKARPQAEGSVQSFEKQHSEMQALAARHGQAELDEGQ